jgi:CBS domain-containing protein
MARTIAELMTRDPICVSADSPVSEAARRMADADVGAALVVDAEQVVRICTDRGQGELVVTPRALIHRRTDGSLRGPARHPITRTTPLIRTVLVVLCYVCRCG